MKKLIPALAGMALLMGCNPPEKILPANEGRWSYESWEEKHYENGRLVRDTFVQENLGGLVFEADGSGYTTDPQGTPVSGSEFEWTADDDLLVRTGQDGFALKSVILDNRKKAQLWATNIQTILDRGNGPDTLLTERIESLVRDDQ